MARGIGGEDGPSLWMFVAVILVWGSIKSWMTETKDTVKDTLGLGQNSGGPFQNQTSEQIKTMDSEVKGWFVQWSALPKPKSHYQTIANALFAEMCSNVNIDEAKIIATCKPLNRNELVAVAKSFGVRDRNYIFGFTAWTGNIFQLFDIAFDGYYKKEELAELKRIWAPTKLW